VINEDVCIRKISGEERNEVGHYPSTSVSYARAAREIRSTGRPNGLSAVSQIGRVDKYSMLDLKRVVTFQQFKSLVPNSLFFIKI